MHVNINSKELSLCLLVKSYQVFVKLEWSSHYGFLIWHTEADQTWFVLVAH